MNSRVSYYDNAKFLLIFLVVLGHLIQSYIYDNRMIFSLYTTIYLFHMPAFILISGYFAKGFRKKGYFLKVTKKLLGPYLIFQGFYSSYHYFNNDQISELDPFNPRWSLWFLLSLFCWNGLLFLFTKWKPGFAIFLSLCLGVIVGYFEEINVYLSLSRTFVFFPLFLLGYYFKKEHFEKLRTFKLQLFSLLMFFSVFMICLTIPEFEYKWLFGSKPYEDFHTSGLNGGIIRLSIYGISIIVMMGFFALVPTKNYFFTKWGARSLYVYLLHGFVIQLFRGSSLEELFQGHYVFVMIIAFILTAVFSTNIIVSLTEPIIELSMSKIKDYGTSLYAIIRNQRLIPKNVRKQDFLRDQTHYLKF